MARRLPRTWGDIRRDWGILSVYQRFEALVALLLRGVIGAVILVALYRLMIGVIEALVLESLDPLDHVVFQRIFGEIMTLLIALEFNHSLQYVIAGERGIVQAKVVIVIALLALARKAIVLDLYEVSPAHVLALAALTLTLGISYWLMRERDDRIGEAGDQGAREVRPAPAESSYGHSGVLERRP